MILSADPKHELSYKVEVWRKLIHLSSLWMPAYIYWIGTGSIYLFVILLAGLSLYELSRRYEPTNRSIIVRSFNSTLRSHETGVGKYSLTGAFYVVLAALIGVCLFSELVAATSLIIMLVGDTAAALIGRRYGTIKIGTKSAEGVIAFIAASILAVLAFGWVAKASGHYFSVALIGTVVGAVAELYAARLKLDDNLAVVLAVGCFIQYFYFF